MVALWRSQIRTIEQESKRKIPLILLLREQIDILLGHTVEKIRYRRDVDHFIEMPGLASDSVGHIRIDGKYALVQASASYSLAIVPLIGADLPQFEELVFYANCLSYDNDLPVYISPVNPVALTKPVESGPFNYINQNYFHSMGVACEAINAIKLGPLGFVDFRYPGLEKDIELHLTLKYSVVAQEQSFYSTALRQLDPLSEFLHYYRIIESVSGDNGKGWIRSNLPRLHKYDFGFLHFESGVEEPNRRINLFSVYRKRALSRLKDLQAKLKGKDIAAYFYNETRCGIAHGVTNVKEYDYSYNVIEISRDVYVLKLLSRIAIEDKIRLCNYQCAQHNSLLCPEKNITC